MNVTVKNDGCPRKKRDDFVAILNGYFSVDVLRVNLKQIKIFNT